MLPAIVAGFKGLAALPKLVDQIQSLVGQLGSLERKINDAAVAKRLENKRSRNAAAIKRVRPAPSPPR